MKADLPTKDVKFTTKGQIVIPRRLREQFHIEAGTRAVIQATPEGILIKPVSRESIKRAGHAKTSAGGTLVDSPMG